MAHLLFASNNIHKTEEIRSVVKQRFIFKTLKEAGIDIDIPEPYNTLEENAREKSKTIYALTNTDCFSEDTGLFTDALSGEPGAKSARYADGSSYAGNIERLMAKLNGIENRGAFFTTIISLVISGNTHIFSGTCRGTIIANATGNGGFGYDPVFMPLGSLHTFAQMTLAEKNIFSHRRKAVESMITFIASNYPEKYTNT